MAPHLLAASSTRYAQLLRIPTSIDSLSEITGTLCTDLGIDGFILQSRVTRFVSGEVEVFASNAAADWRELCRKFGLGTAGDPLVKGLMDQSAPLLWRDATRIHPAIFALAREHGMGNGISHVARGRGGAWTIASFVARGTDAQSEDALLAGAPLTQLLTCHLHDAVARIRAIETAMNVEAGFSGSNYGVLSVRERECLMLAAIGKTADGIAGVLGISFFTVTEHLKDARQKLGAANIPHAVALAISRGYLSAHIGNPL